MVRTTLTHGALLVAGMLALTGAGSASASAVAPVLDKEQALVCFRFGPVSPPPGATRTTLKLSFWNDVGATAPRGWGVNGIEKGRNGSVPALNYINELAGTAVLAQASNGQSTGPRLKVGLTGTDYGMGPGSASPGIWAHNFALTLAPKSLAGTFAGTSVFTPIIADGTPGTPTTQAVLQPIRKISCRLF